MSKPDQSIIDRIKADERVRYLIEVSGERHLIDLPVALLEEHEVIAKARAKSPANVDLLRDSIAKTGNTPVYMPCVFVAGDEPVLHYFNVDGKQRVRASLAEWLTVQYIGRWTSIELALADAVSLNFARYEPTDQDVLSILNGGKLTNKEVADRTGRSEATIHRLEKVAGQPYCWEVIQAGVLGYVQMGKLIDACGGDPLKQRALQNTISEKVGDASAKAKEWQHRIRTDKSRKYGVKEKAKAQIKSYFRDFNWDHWQLLLQSDDGIDTAADGRLRLRLDDKAPGAKGKAVWIGDVKDWESEFAVYGLFGSKQGEVLTEDLQMVWNNWDYITGMVRTQLDRRLHAEADKAHPLPSQNPTITPEPPPEPAPQEPPTSIGRRRGNKQE
jgi:hypothetical protein